MPDPANVPGERRSLLSRAPSIDWGRRIEWLVVGLGALALLLGLVLDRPAFGADEPAAARPAPKRAAPARPAIEVLKVWKVKVCRSVVPDPRRPCMAVVGVPLMDFDHCKAFAIALAPLVAEESVMACIVDVDGLADARGL